MTSETTGREYHWIMTVETPRGRATSDGLFRSGPDTTHRSVYWDLRKSLASHYGLRERDLTVLSFTIAPNQL